MGARAAVVGASGYAGGELLRLLLGHPEVSLGPLVAAGSAGRSVIELHPHLTELADRTFVPPDDASALDADVIFLALPHGRSAAVAGTIPPDALVVDLGADHRLTDPGAWARWYGGEPAGSWVYGLPELPGARAAIAGAKRIANPGCYPTAVILALAPLLAAGLVDPSGIVVVAASGTTGAGRKLTDALAASRVMGDVSAYKVGGAHQHTPEIAQGLGIPTLSFTPVLVPMPRGILATCTAPLQPSADTAALRTALENTYEKESFVHVLPEGQWPHTAATVGSNAVHLQAVADPDAGRAVVVAAIDNLGKGAAGQAIQNANLALGLPESTGLPLTGVGP
jgi:N-acetyl-gamma-glutamyl-phosphate reductase